MSGIVHWEILSDSLTVQIRRSGRFIVADHKVPHRTISTSARNGGQVEHVHHLVNHQSCEGTSHTARSRVIVDHGPERYHDSVCAEIELPADDTATMGTAANMNYAALVTEADGDVQVTAVVTAGVQTNAVCAGDPATWRETERGVVKVTAVAGTINTMVLVTVPLSAAALARTVVTMTEGKSAALQDLAVPSCYSPDLATGTGTDQYCVSAPLNGAPPLTSASPHLKLGEITGLAVRRATLEALRWQNGLEPSYTRGLFHALGRYGIREQSIFEDLTPLLTPDDLELLRKNSKAVFYEPLVGAAAHALAAIADRVRHGTLPDSVCCDALVQQAATLASGLAAKPDRWSDFHSRLHLSRPKGLHHRSNRSSGGLSEDAPSLKDLVLAAIALGWSQKWRTD